MPAVTVVVAMTGSDTRTSGSNGSPGWVKRADAPRAKQMMPPRPSKPWLVTVSSSPIRTIASRISSKPAMLSGRLPKPMKARMIARAPRMPVTKFGFCSSNRSP